MDAANSNTTNEERNSSTFREVLIKYLKKWPVFLFFLVICIGLGVVYSRYTVPVYVATTSFLVKQADNSASSSDDLLKSAMGGKTQTNLNDEILQIGSRGLLERTVNKHDFNIHYYKKGRLLNIDIYKDAPFRLIADKPDSITSTKIYVQDLTAKGGNVLVNPENPNKKIPFLWRLPFIVNGKSFLLNPADSAKISKSAYIVTYDPPAVTAAELSGNLTIKTLSEQTNAITLSLKTQNQEEGRDELNGLFNEFNLVNIEDRNKLSASTVQFIDERLAKISGELRGVEGNLESFQGTNQLVDIKNQSSISLQTTNNISKNIKDLAVQQEIVSSILTYLKDPENTNKLVPSSMGLSDGTLNTLITQYNELQLKRQREAPSVAANSTVMQDLNLQLNNLKNSLLEGLTNTDRNLKLQAANFAGQSSQAENFLSAVPHNERVVQDISRKQGITESLYTYLLQKREEAAISSTSTSQAHYKQLDLATSYGPVEPSSKNIIVYSVLLGLFLAFSWVYFSDLLNDNITTRQLIARKARAPVIGEINHASKLRKQPVAVLERSIISEQFRAIRTYLSFALNSNQKNILVTSSMNNEGKSFVSLNLAAVFAIPGKKVALLEFDIRKPMISTNLNISNEKGITDYLAGDERDIAAICVAHPEIPSLHIFPCGQLPPNPGDVLLSDHMAKLFEDLRAVYDYIIIDSPPTKLVSDSFILDKYSNIVLYVVRQHTTKKKDLEFINDSISNKTLKNIRILFNDIKDSEMKAYDGYFKKA